MVNIADCQDNKKKENANLFLRGEFQFNNSVYCSTVGKRDITGQHFSSSGRGRVHLFVPH